MSTRFQVQRGDRVAYSAAFLRSIGCQTGELPQVRGVVTAVQPLGDRQLVTIDWGTDAAPAKVMACNLARVGPNNRFCAC